MADSIPSREPVPRRLVWGLLVALTVPVANGCGPAVSDGDGESMGTTTASGTRGSTSDNATLPADSSSGSGPVMPEPESSSGSGGEPEPPPPSCPDGLAPGGWQLGRTVIPKTCEDPTIDDCRMDVDHDGVPFVCDNADDVTNPGQADADADGIGDFADLCPVDGGDPNNSADSDRDGVGNACDLCPRTTNVYNDDIIELGISSYLLVRGNPSQLDTDQDGIGDACDNCPTVPNCGDFGPDNPGSIFEDVPRDDATLCQADADGNGVGDACEGAETEGSAGVAGFLDADDFDQDGLPNAEDACPRLPVAAAECENDDGCPTGASCGSTGRCNHVDTDADGVGNVCDTCPETPNPAQRSSAAEMEADDADGDFIGAACELGDGCADRQNQSAPAFFSHAAHGLCCVRSGVRDALTDPDGRPLRPDCQGDSDCTEIPASVWETPGVGVLPVGCDEVLLEACVEEASPVTLADVDGDLEALWAFACSLPSPDQDLDGIGERCDYCPFAFDPTNTTYVDANGMSWPNDGAVCNGDYHSGNLDPANGCQP